MGSCRAFLSASHESGLRGISSKGASVPSEMRSASVSCSEEHSRSRDNNSHSFETANPADFYL